MGTKKSFVKGLAAGAVLGAVAAIMHTMQDRDKKAQELQRTAMRIKDKVAAHAKKLGKLTKAAYGKIVETTIAEYRGVKALSEDELNELRGELKAGWTDVQQMINKKRAKK
jgi:gas vesicle protein